MFHSNNSPAADLIRRRATACTLALVCMAAGPVRAQEAGSNAIDELLESLAGSASVQAEKVTRLPQRLQGRLVALAEFDEESGQWQPMDGPQEIGVITAGRIELFGREAGQDGFAEARYVEFMDRRVVSYTGLTPDRRLSISLYDDEADAEHLVLNVRIGPHQLKYLLRRPGPAQRE